ncbi:MAG: two-component system, OmpR family, sensor kinase [Thermoleophilaceae bacterium]|nr:two-component system, OmpR family, sensor kinase [Thermoleophilaceae bacterium]
MIGRLGGLRLQLGLAIFGVSLGVLIVSLLVLQGSIASDLRGRVDGQLRDQAAEFERYAASQPLTPDSLPDVAKRFLDTQRYHAASRIFAISPTNGRPVTNEPELLERERAEAEGQPGGEASPLLSAEEGFSTVAGQETGRLRVYTVPIQARGQTVGMFRVADPLTPLEDVQSELSEGLLWIGLLAMAASLLAAAAVAAFVTRPIRRMASVARAVGEGDLDKRMGKPHRNDEIGLLAGRFDQMLDRLQLAFTRQRDFVSDASHELRTPLTVMRGQLELLADEPDRDVRGANITVIVREVDHMARLVDDMLTLAGADTRSLVVAVSFSLGDFIEDLRRDLPLLGSREYEVTTSPGGTLTADPERLNQVLRNLVRNAVEATEPTTGRITVEVRPTAQKAVRFSVRDNGPGIPPAEAERIFDRFHRVRAGRSDGAGLGLAIARVLVEAHGGRIWSEAPDGGGAMFVFEIPGYEPGG